MAKFQQAIIPSRDTGPDSIGPRTHDISPGKLHSCADQGRLADRVEDVVRRLTRVVKIPVQGKVSEYLARYPDLLSPLVPICEELRQEFPPPTELSLEVYQDPEIDDRYLVLYVRPVEYDRAFLDRLEVVSAKSLTPITHVGRFDIMTDFRSPGGVGVISMD
jgi:hypothetical protein